MNIILEVAKEGENPLNKIKCFLLNETKESRLYIRRYTSSGSCSATKFGMHNKSVLLAQGESKALESRPVTEDLRPTVCDCGYKFAKNDPVVTSVMPLYKRSDNDKLVELREAEVGAMWYSDSYPWKGPDRKSLVVRTPGGDWSVDMQASNCDKKDDKAHKCWVRHGKPPEVTVDKNGHTCSAGAGSIVIRDYHGFLRNGYLERC